MIRSRLGLKALGLCALVLGLMAFATSAAQAEVGAKWVFKVKTTAGELREVGVPNDTLLPKIQIKEIEKLLSGELVKHMVLLSAVVKKKFEILCTGAELETIAGSGARLLLNGTIESFKVKFTGCEIKIGGVKQAACEPHTGIEKGMILTKEIKGLIVLHELADKTKDPLVRFEPVTGKEFVTFETSAECAIGEKIPVIGKFTFKDSQNKFTNDELTDHLIEQGPLTELWTFTETTEHVANIDGSALVHMIGEHENWPWGGLPA